LSRCNYRVERPDFYIPFDGSKAYQNGSPLSNLSAKQSDIDRVVAAAAGKYDIKQLRYVYIVGRHYWLAVLSPPGDVVAYIDQE
jgi:hypothetical protein